MVLIISLISWLSGSTILEVFESVNTYHGKVLQKSWKGPWKVLEFQTPGRGGSLDLVNFLDNWLDVPIFASVDPNVTFFHFVNSMITGPNLTKLLHNAKKPLPFNFLKSDLQFCNTFWNASVLNEGWDGHVIKFGRKIGCHGNIPWAITKWMNA